MISQNWSGTLSKIKRVGDRGDSQPHIHILYSYEETNGGLSSSMDLEPKANRSKISRYFASFKTSELLQHSNHQKSFNHIHK